MGERILSTFNRWYTYIYNIYLFISQIYVRVNFVWYCQQSMESIMLNLKALYSMMAWWSDFAFDSLSHADLISTTWVESWSTVLTQVLLPQGNPNLVGYYKCNTNIELLAVSLRPFYLPREFPQLCLILVYIHLKANAAAATEHISTSLNRLERISPGSPTFFLGDLNHCSPVKALEGFHQYVTCSTCLGKTLDKCYGSLPDAYRSVALPPLGSADNNTVQLIPAYIPIIRRVKTVTKNIKQWTNDSVLAFQGCFWVHRLE